MIYRTNLNPWSKLCIRIFKCGTLWNRYWYIPPGSAIHTCIFLAFYDKLSLQVNMGWRCFVVDGIVWRLNFPTGFFYDILISYFCFYCYRHQSNEADGFFNWKGKTHESQAFLWWEFHEILSSGKIFPFSSRPWGFAIGDRRNSVYAWTLKVWERKGEWEGQNKVLSPL